MVSFGRYRPKVKYRYYSCAHFPNTVRSFVYGFSCSCGCIWRPIFLIAGIYQMISGTRARIAKKIFGTLQLDKETSACISARIAERVAKDEHKSREFCPFCGSSNVSEPETEFNSLTGVLNATHAVQYGHHQGQELMLGLL